MEEPIECQKCGLYLQNLEHIGSPGYSTYYKKDKAEGSEYVVDRVLCRWCSLKEDLDEYIKTEYLNTRLITEGACGKIWMTSENNNIDRLNPTYYNLLKTYGATLLKLANISEYLHLRAKLFEKSVYGPIIQPAYAKENFRYLSDKKDDIKILVGGCAGRVLVTLETPQADITFIGLDEPEDEEFNKKYRIEPGSKFRMGVQNCHGKLEDIKEIIQKIQNNKNNIKLKKDDEVSII